MQHSKFEIKIAVTFPDYHKQCVNLKFNLNKQKHIYLSEKNNK